MRVLWGLLVLSMLVCASAEEGGGEQFPVEFSGTWLGSVGKLRNVVLHSAKNGSAVGSATFASSFNYDFVLLEYAPEESKGGAIGLWGNRSFESYHNLFRGWPKRFFRVQTFGDKLLVDDWADGEKTSFVLVRKDDGTVAKGGCYQTPAEKLKATLKKKGCRKSKAG